MKTTRTVKNIASLLLIPALLAALLAGCAAPKAAQEPTLPPVATAAPVTATAEPATAPKDLSVTVTDMMGRTITIPEPATRVVALTASDCEILYALGAGDALVGRGEYCDYPAGVLSTPSVQSGYETNVEQIIALRPQVLLMNSMAQPKEQVDALEAAGIAVVVSEPVDIEGVYTSIGIIGALLGRDDAAKTVVETMQATFADVKKAAKDEGKTVYFEVSPLAYGLWTAGAGTFMDEIAAMLGLKNAFSDVSGWAEISEEQVITRNPDYIVTIGMYFGEGPTPTEEILVRKGWENVTAVKNQAVVNFSNNELSRPTPRLAEGAKLLSDFVYGNHAA